MKEREKLFQNFFESFRNSYSERTKPEDNVFDDEEEAFEDFKDKANQGLVTLYHGSFTPGDDYLNTSRLDRPLYTALSPLYSIKMSLIRTVEYQQSTKQILYPTLTKIKINLAGLEPVIYRSTPESNTAYADYGIALTWLVDTRKWRVEELQFANPKIVNRLENAEVNQVAVGKEVISLLSWYTDNIGVVQASRFIPHLKFFTDN